MEVFKDLNFNLSYLNSTSSTNIHAHQYLIEHPTAEGTVFYTDFQEEGKGQRGAKWQSDCGLNLLLSIVLQPNIKVENRFLLSQAISLAIYSTLDKLSVKEVNIKWPNDILVKNRKIGGILIENVIKGSIINTSIVGVGLNINQTDFDVMDREATSLKIELKKKQSIIEILELLLEQVKIFYHLLYTNTSKITSQYDSLLYGKGVLLPFQDENGNFEGVILKVNANGELLIQQKSELVRYGIKEVKFKV